MEQLVIKTKKTILLAENNNVNGTKYHKISLRRAITTGDENLIVRACHQAIKALEATL